MSSRENILQSVLLPLLSAVVLIALSEFGLLDGVRSLLDTVVIPTKKSVSTLRHYASFGNASPEASNAGEIATRLVDQVEFLRLQEENAALRKQLEAPYAPDTQFVPAHIIGIGEYSFTIDVGSVQNIHEGFAVVSEKNILGRIKKVSPKTAIVEAIIHPDSKLPATTVGSYARGLAVGTGGSVQMDQILQEDTVLVDDIVVTSDLEHVPPDLIIGTIQTIEASDEELFKIARITTALDYRKLHTVFVITP